jgi:hypothetical protein
MEKLNQLKMEQLEKENLLEEKLGKIVELLK